jgi:protocatechuate 3,4-dioxygenase beta subunit
MGVLPLLASAARGQGLPVTPAETTGPFYPEPLPNEGLVDLTRTAPAAARAAGRLTEVRLKVVRPDGQPVPSAMLLVWQANAAGRYRHSRDASIAPLDPAFRGAALTRADAGGGLRLLTVRPGAYQAAGIGRRTPHLHWEAIGADSRIATQMYFAGEPLNDADNLIARMKAKGVNPAPMMATAGRPTLEGAAEAWDWTLVLAKG